MNRACQKGGPLAAVVMMVIKLASVGNRLCQDPRSYTLVFENLPTRGAWVRGYVPSRPTLNGTAPQKSGGCVTCLVSKGPRVIRRGPYGTTRWQDAIHFMFGGEPGMACPEVWFLLLF
jgi:hypothetical protein